MSSTEIEPIEFLNLNYGKLRDAWAAFFLDQSCDFSAPGFTWEEASESAPITDQERLLKAGELTAVGAGLCVVHYLRTLTKAYRFNRRPDGSLDDHDWPGSAAFALGRGVLEASAVLAWLMDPVLCPGERACRAARIVLWSAKHDRRQHSDPEVWTLADWRAAAESIGLEVKEDRNGKIRVGTADGNPELFSHTKVIKEVFGEEGRELYARWSGVAHQATWALADWISLTIDNYGAASAPTKPKPTISTSLATSHSYSQQPAQRPVDIGAGTRAHLPPPPPGSPQRRNTERSNFGRAIALPRRSSRRPTSPQLV